MKPIGEILKDKQQLTVSSTVNSYKDINNTVNGVSVKGEYRELEKKTDELLNELRGNPEFVADKLARELDDQKSQRYFLVLARNTDPKILLEALSYTKLANRDGKIKNKGKYFMSILIRWKIKVKFHGR
jgi:hypothetical protein